MRITRSWAMPNRDTFSIGPIFNLISRHMRGVVVDPFARNSKLATHSNDLDPSTSAQHHMDAVDFLAMLAEQGVRADTVLVDPPYSPRQISECYKAMGRSVSTTDTQNAAMMARIRAGVRGISGRGTVVMTFGWNSVGMGEAAGFDKVEILMVCHGGQHNDTICVVERLETLT